MGLPTAWRLRSQEGSWSEAHGRLGGCPEASSGVLLVTRPPFLLPQAVGPGGVAGPVQIVNNKFLAWSGVMEWQEVSLGWGVLGDLETSASFQTGVPPHS